MAKHTVTQQQVEQMHQRIIAATGYCVTNRRVEKAMTDCGDHFMRVVNHVRNEIAWDLQAETDDFARDNSRRCAEGLALYLAGKGWRGLSVERRRSLVAHHRRMMDGANYNGMPKREAFRVVSNLLKCQLIELAVWGAVA